MSSNLWFLHRRQYEAIDAFWDAVVERSPAEPIRPETVDAASAGTIRRLHALAPQPAPSLAFADRLLAELTAAIPETGQPEPAPSHTDMHGETNMTSAMIAAPSPPKWFPTLPKSRTSRRWVLAQLAAAALLIAALVGGYIWFDNRNEQPAVVVQPATPEATPGSGWTHLKGNAARSGVGNAGPTGQPIELWRVQAGGPCNQPPIVVGETVFAGCGDGILYALNVADGSEVWTFAADGPIGTGLSAAGDLVYVSDSDGILYAVDIATGSEVWRFGLPVFITPAIENGLLVTGSVDGMLVGIDAQTGAERWRYQVTDSGDPSIPAIANGVAYAGSSAGGLVAVDATTGELRWRAETPEGGTGTAAVTNGVVFIGSFSPDGSSTHLAFDAESGDLLWSAPLQYGTVSVQNGVGFGVNQNDQVSNVISFSTTDGSERWRTEFPPENRPIAVAGDVVYVPSDADQAIYALDAATGAELWQFEVDGPMHTTVAVTDGRLFTVTMTGSIYAIGGTGEQILAAPGSQASPGATPLTSTAGSPVAASSPNASNASPVELVWTIEGGDGGFDNPNRMAFDPAGRLWVADNGNDRFQIFDTDGTYLESWGEAGSGDGQFHLRRPNGDGYGDIAFAEDGSFYVLDPGNYRVQKFDADRNFVTSWGGFGSEPGQFGDPMTLAITPEGTIWVGDDVRQDYQQFSTDAEFLGSFSPPNGAEVGNLLGVTATGNLIASTFPANEVVEFDANGAYLRTFGSGGSGDGEFADQPGEIAFGGAGEMFITDHSGRIQAFDSDGTFLTGWKADGALPWGLAIDEDGNIYVAAYESSTLTKYRLLPSLGAQTTPTAASPVAATTDPVEMVWTTEGGDGGFDNPARMAIDPQGRIWVTDSGNNHFQIYDTDGDLIETWGSQGSGDGQFHSDPGQFTEPVALAVAPDGTIWVGDGVLQLYQQFDADGQLLSSFQPPDGAEVDVLLAATPQGTLIASTLPIHEVLEYDSNGAYLRTIATAGNADGQFKGGPAQVAFGESGTMFFTETPEGGRVQVLGPDGTFLAGWGEEGLFPAGIVVDKDGGLYVTDYFANSLTRYRLLPPLIPEATPVA